MKVTLTQIMDFANKLPVCIDHDSFYYGRIAIEQEYMGDKLIEWLKSLGIEVELDA